jgi:hypothetical protein
LGNIKEDHDENCDNDSNALDPLSHGRCLLGPLSATRILTNIEEYQDFQLG